MCHIDDGEPDASERYPPFVIVFESLVDEEHGIGVIERQRRSFKAKSMLVLIRPILFFVPLELHEL